MIEHGYVLSALLESQGRSLGLERSERALPGVPRVVAAGRARVDELGVDEGRAPALHVLKALPDDRWLVQEYLVSHKGIKPTIPAVRLVQHGQV